MESDGGPTVMEMSADAVAPEESATSTTSSGHAMAYDVARERVVLFGADGRTFSNATWEWDGTQWTGRNPVSGGAVGFPGRVPMTRESVAASGALLHPRPDLL